MTRNPEFRRNLLLELTTHRLLAMPAVLLLGFMLAYAVGGSEGALRRTGWVALGLYAAITLFWGTQLAIASVIDEFRDRTWDTQRLSALGPWTLTWGKLLGGPVFAWYGGAICVPVFVLGMLARTGGAPPEFSVFPMVALMLGGAVLVHALGVLSGLLLPRGGQRNSSLSVAFLLLFAAMSGWPLIMGAMGADPVSWWGVQWDSAWFSVVTCWLFAAWAVTGVYRIFCAELQVRTMPVAWVGFAAFLSIYLCGFAVGRVDDISIATLFAAIAFAVTLTMTYLSVWVEKRDVISVRRLVLRYRTGDRRRTLEEMPCWLATAPLALLFALYLLLCGEVLPFPGIPRGPLSAMALVLCLLALRDIALLYYFSFAKNVRNAGTTAIVYLVLLYWLLPALLASMNLTPLAQLVFPPMNDSPLLAIVVSIAQAGLAGWLAATRWQQRVDAVAPAVSG